MRRIVCVVALVAGLAAVSAVPARAGPTLLAPGRVPPDVAGRYGIGLTTFTAADPARPGRTLTLDESHPVALMHHVRIAGLARPPSARSWRCLECDATPSPSTASGSRSSRSPMATVVFGSIRGSCLRRSLLTATSWWHPTTSTAWIRPRWSSRTAFANMSFAIDQALARSAAATDLLAGTVDESRIAVTGFSYGGFTALAMAGGYQGWGPDERVDAIVPIAATPVAVVARHGTSELLAEPLAAIDVPTLLLYGTADAERAAETWRGISASPAAWRVNIHRAGHLSFTNICDQLAALRDVGLSPAPPLVSAAKNQGCGPKLIPVEKAHRITVQYVVDFLRTTLRDDVSSGTSCRPSGRPATTYR